MFGECHGHMFMDGINYKEARKGHSDGPDEKDIRRKLAEYADAGVKFYRDGGDALGVSSRAAQLAPEYGIDFRTPAFAIHKNGHYGAIVGRGFDDMKEYAELVGNVRESGGDFIKVMFSGILDFDQKGGVTGTALEREEIREMIHIAHEEGFAVMAHVNGDRAVRDAIEAGVDSVEHGNFMEEETLHALAESDTVWVPTNVTLHNLIGSGRYNDSDMRMIDEMQRRNIVRAFALGACIALGSDAGAYRVPHVFGIIDELHAFEKMIADHEALYRELNEAELRIKLKFSV